MSERYRPGESRQARADRRAAQSRYGFEKSDFRENHPRIQNSVDGQPAPEVTWGTETGQIDAEAHRSLYGMDQLEDEPADALRFNIHPIVDFVVGNQWAYRDQYPELPEEKQRDIDVV